MAESSELGSAVASRGRRLRRAGLTAALVIVAVGAVAYWVAGRNTPGRDPLEFLPSSTCAVVALDMRPESPGLRQALRH